MAYLIDTTLREGAQGPGVCFDLALKKQIAAGLVDTGIDEVELGLAAAGDQELKLFGTWFTDQYPNQPFSLWCRCCDRDIYFAKGVNPDVLALSIPVSDLHLTEKLKKNRAWAKKTLEHAIRFAFFLGFQKVAVGFEDATRADVRFVREMAEVVKRAGGFRIRLADTVGVASPATMCKLIDAVADLDVQVGVHCHNDFGMATANTIASLEHGVNWGDVTVLGLGERAGNSRLEEVATFLTLHKKWAGYDLLAMRRLSQLLLRATGRQISESRAILGESIFTCETGLHLQGLLANPKTYEPYDPCAVGASRRLVFGSKVGCHAMGETLKRLGFPRQDKVVLAELTSRVRSLASDRQRGLADHEIIGLAVSCLE
jgi:homocitrate synthase NifV